MKIMRRILALGCALTMLLPAIGVYADNGAFDESLPETVIPIEETTIDKEWTVGPQAHTANAGGGFDPAEITAGGYFAVDYTGTKGKVYLALAEWESGTWASVNNPSYTIETEKGYRSYFSYEDCVTAYKGDDFSSVDAICVGTTQGKNITVTGLSWFGKSVATELGETDMLFKGSATASSARSCLTFIFTKHVGGEWDASKINEGSYFYAEYEGPENGIYIALMSHSGATRWVQVNADETGVTEDGKQYSIFKYDNFAKKFGTNFVKMDQIQIYSGTSKEVTLKRFAYFAGEGAPVDTSDGTWDRPDTGIAFIGDSIVENPLVDGDHLRNMDWNGILQRDDCVNYGIGGQTTRELVARIDEVAKKNYEKVVFLCGINDIGKGLSNAGIKKNYRTMIETLTESNPEIEIFIISVLPTTDAFYTNMQSYISGLNIALFGLCNEYENVTYVDCYFSFVGENSYCKEGLTFDGLHPNLEGYSIIAEKLNPYLDGTVGGETESETEASATENESASEDCGMPDEDAKGEEKGDMTLPIAVAVLLIVGSCGYTVMRNKKAKEEKK